MLRPNWNQRFQKSTRGRIITLLRRGDATVNELAEALKITDNAIRTHLSSLERDGLVEQCGVRRGVGAPAYVYGFTVGADVLLSKAYPLVLNQVLDVLVQRMELSELEALLCEAGRRVKAGKDIASQTLRQRVDSAVDVLNELGGLAEVTEIGSHILISSDSCPLSAVVSEHPEVCKLVEALLQEIIGDTVHEHCNRTERPRCSFEVSLNEKV